MLHIIKDMVKLSNWAKLIKNPSKFKKVFNERINYYPGLKFGYTKNKKIKKLYINFNTFFAKKNNQFDKIFYQHEKESNNTDINFYVDSKFEFNKEHFESLKKNGILVLKNILPKNEYNEICNKFDKVKKNELNLASGEYYQNLTGKSEDTKSTNIGIDVSSYENLIKISNQITEEVYGKSIDPSAYIMYTKSINLPDRPCNGDNVWHTDRYLPNLKLIYFPFKVDEDSAPFRYSLGSHKIDGNYLDFFINQDEGNLEKEEDEKKFLKNPKELTVEQNTLVVALTNGFHGRKAFNKKKDRSALFLCYPNFNLLSLISFWRYNS